MKKNEKRMIAVLILLTVIIAIVWIVRTNSLKNNSKDEAVAEKNAGEYSEVIEDGIRKNNSKKLSETKTYEGLELSGLELKEKDNLSELLGTAKNVGSEVTPEQVLKFTFVDKDGNELKTIEWYAPAIQPGESIQLNTNVTSDAIINAYDFKIAK